MAAEPNPLLTQLRQLNEKLTLSQKLSISGLGLAILAGLLILAHFMSQEDYQTLYSNLNADEANTVVTRLKSLKTPYELADSGRTIKVPQAKVDELRIQLASEGLPQTGKIGFEIFDKTNLGMTEFLEKVSYKRALEGELARTILSLKEVAQARVHLVLPKESLFEEKSEPTKASVVIKLNAGKQISDTMVSGIVHLVSSAVEGLNPQNVTVVDISGRMLSAKQGSSEEALTATQMELKARYEKDLMRKIINIVEPVVGEGRVKTDTSVALNFNRSEQTEEKFNPQQTAIRSQQKSEERVEPLAPVAPAGVPGTKSNQATPPPNFIPLTGRSSNSSFKQSETTNYEISKLVRHTVEPVGDVRKLSVAVIVDDALKLEKKPDGSLDRKTVPRSAEELKKIRELVSAAVGFDANRGDQLTVENIAFDTGAPLDEVKPTFYEKWREVIQPAIRYSAFLILFLLVYFLLIRPVTRKVLAPAEQILVPPSTAATALGETGEPADLPLDAPKTVKELEESMESGLSGVLLPETEVRKSDILRQRIIEFVQKTPENSAQILRLWLTEEGK
jgi:flagellar M-ring protein FliF